MVNWLESIKLINEGYHNFISWYYYMYMQWGSDSIWKILETNRWQEHDHNTRMAIHELFFGCVEHMLVSWGRVCKGGSEVAQSGRECSHRRTSHCCRDRFLSTFSCCTLCSLPKSCISTNQRCLCLTLLLCQYLLNFFFLSFGIMRYSSNSLVHVWYESEFVWITTSLYAKSQLVIVILTCLLWYKT